MTDRIESNHPLDNRPMSVRSLLDDWVAEVGEQRVANVVEATVRCAQDGSIPSFTEKEDIVAHWNARYPRK